MITWIVAPLMFAELGTAIALLIVGSRDPLLLASFAFLAVNWRSTWLIQVPQHRQLGGGFNEDVCRKLVRQNWLRTVSWTLRGILVLVAVYR